MFWSATCSKARRSPRRLSSLAGLHRCAALRWLDVSRNRLAALHGLAAFPVLQTLVASDNNIAAFPDPLPTVFLRELWLNGNRYGSCYTFKVAAITSLGPCGRVHWLRQIGAGDIKPAQVPCTEPALYGKILAARSVSHIE